MPRIIKTVKSPTNYRYVNVGPSRNILKKTSYNLHFYRGNARVAWFTTEDGSLIKLAKIVYGWVQTDMLPAEAIKVTLK